MVGAGEQTCGARNLTFHPSHCMSVAFFTSAVIENYFGCAKKTPRMRSVLSCSGGSEAHGEGHCSYIACHSLVAVEAVTVGHAHTRGLQRACHLHAQANFIPALSGVLLQVEGRHTQHLTAQIIVRIVQALDVLEVGRKDCLVTQIQTTGYANSTVDIVLFTESPLVS